MTSNHGTISYAGFFDRAGKYAAALQACGVAKGERVLVKTRKSMDVLALYVGCLQLGAIYVPVNPLSTSHEVSFFVDDAEPALVVFDPNEDISIDVQSESLGLGGSLTSLAEANDREITIQANDGTDVAAMLYTSGTTGRPKGAMVSHLALISNGLALNKIWGFDTTDVLLHSLPVFHVHGLFVAIHCAMLSGATVILLDK
ncbi:MAG: AMP-binding protein, partial [Actinomycetota bacterium]